MTALLFIITGLTWISQGMPAPPSQTGTVTGTLKTDAGTPAVGVRVGAMVRPESAAEISSASALSSIAETDAAGHFRLENVPQGRYYITAGRVDFPTYYPGTQDLTAGRVVLVKPGDIITGIDFVMNSIAVRPPDSLSFGVAGTPSFVIPVIVKVEGGGRIPVYSAAGFASLRLSRTSDGLTTEAPLSTTNLILATPTGLATPEYRVTVENVPTGYTVSSLKYGAGEIANNILKLSTSNTMVAGPVISIAGGGTTGQILSITASQISAPAAGSTGLAITLLPNPSTFATQAGVRVTGNAPTPEVRSVYLSGVPGIFFADGTFEFRDVKPGRYTVSTPDNPSSSRPLAAAIVVGNQDVTGIELTATPLLPLNIKTPVPPETVGNHTPGTTIPLSAVRGLVLDETTHEPITEGTVYLTGHYGGSRSLVPDGRFEFTRLLPGSYELEVQGFGHSTIKKTIVVGEDDVNFELNTTPLP
jgi:hypothetical protein